MSNQTGTLYIVATPIGNLDDLGPRALSTLKQVSLIAAEDTRHSKKLLNRFAITTPMESCHDFNEDSTVEKFLGVLTEGRDIALISDAGTPLISDPGYRLVSLAHQRDIRVVPIPGPCALVTALSASGLPTDRFVFEGYPPERRAARRKYLEALVTERRTIILYEAPHRIISLMQDLLDIMGAARRVTVARELTKYFETIRTGQLHEICAWISDQPEQQKGEFVVLLEGADNETPDAEQDAGRVLAILLQELPLKTAVGIAAQITGGTRNELYRLGLKISGNQ